MSDSLPDSSIATVDWKPRADSQLGKWADCFKQFTPYEIDGNCAPETKLMVSRWLHMFTHRGTAFGDRTGRRVKITDVSVNAMPNEPERREGRVVAELTVDEGEHSSYLTEMYYLAAG